MANAAFGSFSTSIPNNSKYDNCPHLENFVREFSSFPTRYFYSDWGFRSGRWLLSQIVSALKDFKRLSVISEVAHWTKKQNSIIVRIPGLDYYSHGSLYKEVVIIGSHFDSISKTDRAPGSAVTLEVLRIFIESKFRNKRTIEFHWYGLEEAGRMGSQLIAEQYKEDKINVHAMLNLDVIGYQPSSKKEIAIYTDNGDDNLVQFVKSLVNEYMEYKVINKTCGYGCSG